MSQTDEMRISIQHHEGTFKKKETFSFSVSLEDRFIWLKGLRTEAFLGWISTFLETSFRPTFHVQFSRERYWRDDR